MTYNTTFFESTEKYRLNDVFADDKISTQLALFLKEYNQRELLDKYNLPVSRKLLFFGPSGCGKTFAAQALASELDRKLITVNLTSIVSAKLGQTAQNLSNLFQKAKISKSILFLDEFDSLATIRERDSKESGEMRRVANAIIQLIDKLDKNILLIAATNQLQLIDHALIRRFEHKVEFTLPTNDLLDRYYENQLSNYPSRFQDIKRSYQISYAEAKVKVINEVKKMVLDEGEKINSIKNTNINEESH
ncbi:AAA family ATPase [Aquimarina sediminis]|uniref:AAA family ATPase n=1 Tax=Aquimarina sediminis TaxID=2070536 RepID=UPI000CA08698|nr:ATP-binding protein [Aquimarina sediminis]